jgi:glucose-6-phosphate isomerase
MTNDETFLEVDDGDLIGNVDKSETKIGALKNLLYDQATADMADQNSVAYTVKVQKNGVQNGQQGGLFFGISTLNPGLIGQEYIFTRGHYHQVLDTGEYYWGIKGTGYLMMHQQDGAEYHLPITPGRVLYIPGKVAHRLVNTGNTKLVVGAVWQSISGHQYSERSLFTTHVLEQDGQPVFKVKRE